MSLPADDVVSLPIILAWIRANWAKMALGGLLCALIALPVALLKPKTYESSATLLVAPPTFKDRIKPPVSRDPNAPTETIAEMMPKTLPVEAYKAIALSSPIIEAVIQRVPLENTGIRQLRERLSVELVQMGSRSSQGIMYTQTLFFHAKADAPELAAKIAQTWAEIFKEQVDSVAKTGIGETFALLDTLHTETKSQLETAELALAEHKKAWNLDLIKAQIEAKQKNITKFEDDLKLAEVDLAAADMKVKALDAELAKEPEKKSYFRAPPDDAYWISALQGDGKPKVKPDQGLLTELVNQNYVETRTEGVKAKGELEGFRAKRDTILAKLDEMRKEIDALTATFADKTVERDKLMREAQSLKESYTVVRAEYEKGRMAERTQASDIMIAGNAVVPHLPSSPGSLTIVFVAAFLGILLTAAFLALRDITRMAPVLAARARGMAALMAQASGITPDEIHDKPHSTSTGREDSDRRE